MSVVQPSFLPWRGYFSLIAASDVFVFYDDVQFDKNGWRNRNKIKTPAGPRWITVPVLTKGRSHQMIKDTRIAGGRDWADKILKSLELNYKKAPYFGSYFPWLREVLRREWATVCELDIALTKGICVFLGIETELLRASDLEVASDMAPVARIVEICRRLGATRYLSGPTARAYIDDPDEFSRGGIELHYCDYRVDRYPQLCGEFVAQVSVVDLLFNCGEQSRNYL